MNNTAAYTQTNIREHIGTITFFHPQSNALPAYQLKNIAAAIDALAQDPEVRVLVLRSGGDRAFCAGASFDELVAVSNEEEGFAFFSGFAAVLNAMRRAPQFILARIQGKAVGGGVGIAAAADYAVATEFAAVKLSELAVGIGPFVVGPAVIRKIGLAAFTQLAINATVFQSAAWAKEKGLYAELYPQTDAMDAALNTLAHTLAASNPAAMRHLKQIAWKDTEHWEALLTQRAAISGELVLSEYTKKAIAQFRTKKKQ